VRENINLLVFARGDAAEKASKAGASLVGGEELLEKENVSNVDQPTGI
jgi:ribosomal protein L1